MANSSLATYRNVTGNQSGQRTQKITKITPHYMVAAWSGKQCADYFAGTGRQASSNYCVGVNGDIAVSVDENCRAWASSSEWNDQRAVTIECGNNPDSSLPAAAYNSLVALCADICKRNGINPHYDGTVNGSITMHQQFAATSCPGPWLKNKIISGQFENDIKAKMGQNPHTNDKPAQNASKALYRVRKSWADPKSQLGAFASLDNAKKACKAGYTVYDNNGKAVYPVAAKPAAGKWTQNCILKEGDRAKSVSCGIAVFPGTNSAIKNIDGVNCVNVPALGGGVPLLDVTEASDSKDGNPKDNYLANTNARLTMDEFTVTGIDMSKDTVQVDNAYWVKSGPLMARR